MNNARHLEYIETFRRITQDALATFNTKAALMAKCEELSATSDTNPSGDTLWIVVRERADLEKAMRLAPPGQLWRKENGNCYGPTIDYVTKIDGVVVRIVAGDAALPPTCRLVERAVVIPAMPEHTQICTVIECDHPETTETVKPEPSHD